MLLGISFLGYWWAISDSVAVFRLQISALVFLCAAIAFVSGSRAFATLIMVVSGAALLPIVAGFSGLFNGAPGSITLYQKNLLWKELSRGKLTREIRASDADIITLQEISDHDWRYMEKLFDAYENKFFCQRSPNSSMGILTGFSIIEGSGTCIEDTPFAAVQVQMPDGAPVWVVSVHLGWPFPAGQKKKTGTLVNFLETLSGPVIIAGDFNMVPWGSTVRRIVAAADAKILGPIQSTYPAGGPLFPLPIDHVLVPRSSTGLVEVRPLEGSDHYGLIARFDL